MQAPIVPNVFDGRAVSFVPRCTCPHGSRFPAFYDVAALHVAQISGSSRTTQCDKQPNLVLLVPPQCAGKCQYRQCEALLKEQAGQ
jgi:hypothetical protein